MSRPFDMEEIERAIRNSRDKSSPGIDQIDCQMIKRLPIELKKELLERYNYAFLANFLRTEQYL